MFPLRDRKLIVEYCVDELRSSESKVELRNLLWRMDLKCGF
jgi:hypothetical protein